MIDGIRYRNRTLYDLISFHAVLMINTRGGQGMKNGKRITQREVLGRGPAELMHPEIPFAEEHAADFKASVKESVERRKAQHAAARKRLKAKEAQKKR